MQKFSLTIYNFFNKKSPFILGALIFLSLILIIFRPESSTVAVIELVIGFLLLSASLLGLIVFIFSKQELPKSLLYFSLFVLWSAITLIISLHNDVSFSWWARRFFPVFIFPMIALSVMAVFKTYKQIRTVYITILLISLISILRSLLPIVFAHVSLFPNCDSFRNYSGWNNGLFVFSLGLPILFYNKLKNKILKTSLFLIIGLSIFSMVISLTRTLWIGAAITIFITSLLIVKSADKFSYRSFLNYVVKSSIVFFLIMILTFFIFPQNIKSCFTSRLNSIPHLSKDPAVRDRISESKGVLNSFTKISNSNSFVKTYLTIFVGNGLGSNFTYSSVMTGKQLDVSKDFAHDYYTYILWTTGIIGLFLFLLAIWSFFVGIKRNTIDILKDQNIAPYFIGIITTLFFGVVVYSLVGSPLYISEWAVYYGILFGLGLSIIKNIKNTKKNKKVLILHNIVSPYKVYLFNALNLVLEDFEVIFIARSEHIRKWKFDEKELKFKYKILFNSNIEDINPIMLHVKLINILNRINPDILIIDGYSYFYCWVAMIWGKFKNKKLIFWSSSTFNDHKRFFYKEFFKRLFVLGFDAANTYSTKSKEYLENLGFKSEKILIIGNITDNNFYYNDCEKYKKIGKEIKKEYNFTTHNFLYIGRFSPEKNIFSLLEAFRFLILSNKINNWGLILVGSGPQEEEIKEFILKYNLTCNIKMIGFMQKEEICKFYAISDVLVLPSISETWGLVVNEAMVCGMAVLVSRNCGCYPDIVKDGLNGFSFDPTNVDELKDLLIKFISEEVILDDMKNNSIKIIQDYTPQKSAYIIKKTIESI